MIIIWEIYLIPLPPLSHLLVIKLILRRRNEMKKNPIFSSFIQFSLPVTLLVVEGEGWGCHYDLRGWSSDHGSGDPSRDLSRIFVRKVHSRLIWLLHAWHQSVVRFSQCTEQQHFPLSCIVLPPPPPPPPPPPTTTVLSQKYNCKSLWR